MLPCTSFGAAGGSAGLACRSGWDDVAMSGAGEVSNAPRQKGDGGSIYSRPGRAENSDSERKARVTVVPERYAKDFNLRIFRHEGETRTYENPPFLKSFSEARELQLAV